MYLQNPVMSKVISARIISKLTCSAVALDIIYLTTIATQGDRRWLTQHPIRIVRGINHIGGRGNTCAVPTWFDEYLVLFRRILKQRLSSVPEVTKVRFSHTKGKYLDVSLDVPFLQPYVHGMLTGEYPDNAMLVLPSILRRNANTDRSGVYGSPQNMFRLFKGVGCSYTYRIPYYAFNNSLGGKYAIGISRHIEGIVAGIQEDIPKVTTPYLDYMLLFQKYNEMGDS